MVLFFLAMRFELTGETKNIFLIKYKKSGNTCDTNVIIVSLNIIIMVKKAIIKGKVVRIAQLGNDVEFDVAVSESLIGGKTFTIGTVVNCVARLDTSRTNGFILKEGYFLPTPAAFKEPIKTVKRLAMGDEVEVTCAKIKGRWVTEKVVHKPKKGQDMGEFLKSLEELI